jgi:hypothetical protein
MSIALMEPRVGSRETGLNRHETEIYFDGFNAGRSGAPIEANPLSTSDPRRGIWEDGRRDGGHANSVGYGVDPSL